MNVWLSNDDARAVRKYCEKAPSQKQNAKKMMFWGCAPASAAPSSGVLPELDKVHWRCYMGKRRGCMLHWCLYHCLACEINCRCSMTTSAKLLATNCVTKSHMQLLSGTGLQCSHAGTGSNQNLTFVFTCLSSMCCLNHLPPRLRVGRGCSLQLPESQLIFSTVCVAMQGA